MVSGAGSTTGSGRGTGSTPPPPAPGMAERTEMFNFVRLFEPLVIRAMNLYTTTSSIPLQQQILFLLCRLMVLRVNYSLLDRDRVFVQAVQRQLQMVADGQIRNPQSLLQYIFQFLVLLSQDHGDIISSSAVLTCAAQLLQSPHLQPKHTIQAFRPLVHELFVTPFASGKAGIGGATILTPMRVQVLDILLQVRLQDRG